MCGPGVAPGGVVSAPVSLVDVLPTLLEISEQEPDPSLPGTSLMPLATGGGSPPAAFRDRPVFSEYDAWGMERAGYMLRKGDHKLNYYVGHEPELFDVAADPEEIPSTSMTAHGRINDDRVMPGTRYRCSTVNPWPATGPNGARTAARQPCDSC